MLDGGLDEPERTGMCYHGPEVRDKGRYLSVFTSSALSVPKLHRHCMRIKLRVDTAVQNRLRESEAERLRSQGCFTSATKWSSCPQRDLGLKQNICSVF